MSTEAAIIDLGDSAKMICAEVYRRLFPNEEELAKSWIPTIFEIKVRIQLMQDKEERETVKREYCRLLGRNEFTGASFSPLELSIWIARSKDSAADHKRVTREDVKKAIEQLPDDRIHGEQLVQAFDKLGL